MVVEIHPRVGHSSVSGDQSIDRPAELEQHVPRRQTRGDQSGEIMADRHLGDRSCAAMSLTAMGLCHRNGSGFQFGG
jgi:hypothetical protein